jgi:hypothetical protein
LRNKPIKLDAIRTKRPANRARDISAHDEAAGKLYKSPEGELGIPALNLFASLIEAGRKVKNGKSQISTATSTTLPSFLEIEEFFLPFTASSDWVPDMRRGVSNSGTTKVAVAIVRPRFDIWELKATAVIDDDVIDESIIREVFRVAGTGVGLCDFRPAKKGPFGRFKVTDWKPLD